ncbi:hypothetical protein V5799_030167 [Amblyomma americanum]|uniref:Secreted protein n=1 Tax=Amblyomma americanum TaxID=6943 RepID=A0AAQ4EPJ5_AMBAM
MNRWLPLCLLLGTLSLVSCAYDHDEAHREYELHGHCLAWCQWIPLRTTGCGRGCACHPNGNGGNFGICVDPNHPFPKNIAHSHYGFPEP